MPAASGSSMVRIGPGNMAIACLVCLAPAGVIAAAAAARTACPATAAGSTVGTRPAGAGSPLRLLTAWDMGTLSLNLGGSEARTAQTGI